MKTKQLFLTIAFAALTLLSKAQDKYEFMIIEYSTIYYEISISIDGTEFKKEKPDFSKQPKSGYNANPLLLKVKEYQDKDWEVMNFNNNLTGNGVEFYFAYLRRKK